MKLRRVATGGHDFVEVQDGSRWVRLADVPELGNSAVARDLIALLRQDLESRATIALLASRAPTTSGTGSIGLPFVPRAYRDFSLYEQHSINAWRGHARRFLPGLYETACAYERSTGEVFPQFKPGALWYERPVYYCGSPLNFRTDGDEIEWPDFTTALDYELEIGCVLARDLHRASPEEAEAAIGGFVLFNDFSARDVQGPEMQSGFGPQRSKSFANTISAEVVTPDELLPHWHQLIAEVAINGEVVARCSAAGPRFTLAQALSIISQNERLHAGELFGSGTLPGGCALESGRWLAPGDALTLRIEGILSLTNRIVERRR